jgi:hypothetical protein
MANHIQIYNPLNGKYVKISKDSCAVISTKKTDGPYVGVPEVGKDFIVLSKQRKAMFVKELEDLFLATAPAWVDREDDIPEMPQMGGVPLMTAWPSGTGSTSGPTDQEKVDLVQGVPKTYFDFTYHCIHEGKEGHCVECYNKGRTG